MSINYEELKGQFGTSAKDSPTVVIDSGIGGLNVTAKLVRLKPCENFIFFADQEFLPFGDKNPKILSRRIINIVAKIKKLQPKAVVLACNTIDSVVGDKIEGQLGNTPFIRIIEPTAKEAVIVSKTKQIGLFATINTIDSQKYMIDMLGYSPNTHLLGVECPMMASAIETKEDLKTIVKEEISPLKDYNVDTIILGCTHYSAVIPIIKKQFPDVTIIDSSDCVINYFLKRLEILDYNVANAGTLTVITTKLDDNFQTNLDNYLKDLKYTLLTEEM
ncbi:MAG: glutamate racemase [Mycoplasmatales bacterium]